MLTLASFKLNVFSLLFFTQKLYLNIILGKPIKNKRPMGLNALTWIQWSIILNFDSKKRVTQILSDLLTEHISDKACHEDSKYLISFILI